MDNFEYLLWTLSRQLLNMVGQTQGHFEPYIEVADTADGIRVTAELPGIRPQDIRVNVSEDELTLTVLKNGLTAYTETFEADGLDEKSARIGCLNGVLEVQVPYKKAVF